MSFITTSNKDPLANYALSDTCAVSLAFIGYSGVTDSNLVNDPDDYVQHGIDPNSPFYNCVGCAGVLGVKHN